MATLMNPQVDFVFKNIFGSEKHPKVLISLLNAIFGFTNDSPKRIVKVKIDNPTIHKEYLEDKYSVLDIKATVNDGEIVNIEMQIKNQYNMKERSLYYLSKIFESQLETREIYTNLKRCVVICIMNFNMFNELDNRFHRSFLFKDTVTAEVLSNLMELHYIELPKIKNLKFEPNINDLLTDWLLFLTNPESEVISMLKKKVPEIKEAISILDILSKDKEAREIYQKRQFAILNNNTNLAGAKAEGKAEGIAEGKAEGIAEGITKGEQKEKRDTAKAMLQRGLSDEMIHEITKLSFEEIKQLRSSK
jgi:predicted transposase/invertase (TIGR01784 family)